ncbi:MAG: hypothetical protein K9M57_04370 [Phycisphaerae bacterium]|nr:hypothetical protein [Phycisphaerae bacterium]
MTLPIILLIAGICVIILEIFLPSGGILGVIAGISIISAIGLAFMEDPTSGVIFLALAMVLVPILVVIGFKVFPNTPIGRRVILAPAAETSKDRGAAGVNDDDYTRLIGKTGKTITPLRPSGIAEIDDERLSVISEGVMVDRGVDIIVISIQGNSIVVEQQA